MSQGYVVRMIKWKELVGVYIAEDTDDLYHLVDETTDPACCQFQEIIRGGITWHEKNTPVLGDDECDDDLSGASFTEGMGNIISGRGKWEIFHTEPINGES